MGWTDERINILELRIDTYKKAIEYDEDELYNLKKRREKM